MSLFTPPPKRWLAAALPPPEGASKGGEGGLLLLAAGEEDPHSPSCRLLCPPPSQTQAGSPEVPLRRFSGRSSPRQRPPPTPASRFKFSRRALGHGPLRDSLLFPSHRHSLSAPPAFSTWPRLHCKLHSLLSWFPKHSKPPALSASLSLFLSTPPLPGGICPAHPNAAEGGGGWRKSCPPPGPGPLQWGGSAPNNHQPHR